MAKPATEPLPPDVSEILKGRKIESLSPTEKAKLLARVEEYKKGLEKQQVEAKKADPFWFYKPSTGDLSEERRAFLLKHLKQDDVPQKGPGQTDVHASLAPIRGASGGNRSGKTTLCCIEAYIRATGEVPESLRGRIPAFRIPQPEDGPQHVRVTGKDWENGILGTVLPEYQYWAPREFLPDGDWRKAWSAEKALLTLSKRGRVTGTIEFMSNAQPATAFQGPTKHMQIYDEEPRRDIYKENLARFGTASRIDVLFGMTPTEGLSWVYDLVTSGQDGLDNRVDWFKLASVTNERVNLKVLEQQAHDFSYEEKLMRWLGEFISLSGLVYGRLFSRKLHVIEPFNVRCTCGSELHPKGCPWNDYYVVKGMDPHLVTPTAVVWVALDRWGNKYVLDSWFEEADVDQVKWGIRARDNGLRTGWAVTDSAADSDIKAFNGLNIFKKLRSGANKIRRLILASKGAGSINTGVDELKQALRPHPLTGKPQLYIFNTPANQLLIKAFETMEREKGVQEDRKGPKDKILESKHHLHAALRYVFMQKLGWRSSIEAPPPDAPEFDEEDVIG